MKLVHVQWLDSESATGWTPVSEVEGVLELTHTVGLLLQESEHFIVIAHSYDPATESANGLITIPRPTIEKMRTICRLKLTAK